MRVHNWENLSKIIVEYNTLSSHFTKSLFLLLQRAARVLLWGHLIILCLKYAQVFLCVRRSFLVDASESVEENHLGSFAEILLSLSSTQNICRSFEIDLQLHDSHRSVCTQFSDLLYDSREPQTELPSKHRIHLQLKSNLIRHMHAFLLKVHSKMYFVLDHVHQTRMCNIV